MRMAGLLGDFGYPDGPVRICSARQFQQSIGESVKQVVVDYIHKLGLADEFDVRSFWIDNVRTGSHMWFPEFSRNPRSLMDVEGMDVLWIEQAETIGDEMEVILPTLFRNQGAEAWFTWNPWQRTQWCWQRFVEKPRPDDVHAHVIWEDNPWWFPNCRECFHRYGWGNDGGECSQLVENEGGELVLCGGEIAPGLWKLEQERVAFKEEEPDRYPHVYLGLPDDGDADKTVLPYTLLEACAAAWDAGLAPSRTETPLRDSGLDLAEGGANKCAQVIRQGPVVEFAATWPGVAGDMSVAAVTAHENFGDDPEARRLYYDASSAIKTEFRRLDLAYKVRPIKFGDAVMRPKFPYEKGKQNGSVFERRNIQMADTLRLRAGRTSRLYRAWQDAEREGRELRADECGIDPRTCLFIRSDLPKLERYLSDLCQPIRRENPVSGKWQLDKRGGDAAADPSS